MGTRATVTIVFPDGNETHFYRSHDGYLSECGKDIAKVIEDVEGNVIMLRNMINVRYSGESIAREIALFLSKVSIDELPTYYPFEIIDYHPDEHDDREYHYQVTVADDGNISLWVSRCDRENKIPGITDWQTLKEAANKEMREWEMERKLRLESKKHG